QVATGDGNLRESKRCGAKGAAGAALGVCAAEGLRNVHSKSDLTESLKLDFLDLAKGSATPEIATFGGDGLLPRRLLAQAHRCRNTKPRCMCRRDCRDTCCSPSYSACP